MFGTIKISTDSTFPAIFPFRYGLRTLLSLDSHLGEAFSTYSKDDVKVVVTLENTLSHKKITLSPRKVTLNNKYFGFEISSTDIPSGFYEYEIEIVNSHSIILGNGRLNINFSNLMINEVESIAFMPRK